MTVSMASFCDQPTQICVASHVGDVVIGMFTDPHTNLFEMFADGGIAGATHP